MANFYLDPTAGADTNDGSSWAQAWATLGQVETELLASNIVSGDTVWIRAGASLSWNAAVEGTFFIESGVTIRGENAFNRPTLTGSGDRPFGIRGLGNATYKNLIFSGGTLSVVNGDGTARVVGTFEDCVIQNGTAHGFQQLSGGGAAQDSEYIFRRVRFTNNGTFGCNLTGCRETTIEDCVVDNNDGQGLRVISSGANVVIRRVTAFLNASTGIGLPAAIAAGGNEIVEYCSIYENAQDGTGFDDTSGLKSFSTGTIIRYNRCVQNGLPGTINHGIQLEVGSTNIQCYYNLCWGNKTAGISFTNSGHVIENNTCVDNGAYGISTFSSAISSCTVRNNLLQGNTSYSWRNEASTTVTTLTMDRNLHWGSGAAASIRHQGTDHANLAAFVAATPYGDNSVEGDPDFVDASVRDYRLRSTSPALAEGFDNGYSQDFFGALVDPTTPDIGAFEFQRGPEGFSDHIDLTQVASLS